VKLRLQEFEKATGIGKSRPRFYSRELHTVLIRRQARCARPATAAVPRSLSVLWIDKRSTGASRRAIATTPPPSHISNNRRRGRRLNDTLRPHMHCQRLFSADVLDGWIWT